MKWWIWTATGPFCFYVFMRQIQKQQKKISIPTTSLVLVHIWFVQYSRSMAGWSTTNLKGRLSSISCTSFHIRRTMHVPHALQRNIHTYSINTDITCTHESCGWASIVHCKLVQQGLCAAAAVGLTSVQRTPGLHYHCYSSSIHNLTGTEFTHAIHCDMDNRNFLWIYYELQSYSILQHPHKIKKIYNGLKLQSAMSSGCSESFWLMLCSQCDARM